MATTANVQYGAAVTHTITIAGLATDAQLFLGRAGTAIDNKDTDLGAIDALVGGKVSTGNAPTGSKQIELWAYGTYDDVTFTAGISGTDASANTTSQKSQLKLLQMLSTNAAANCTYAWGPVSVAQAFGGVLPTQWGVYIVHNTGTSLNATATSVYHEVKHIPVKFQSQ